MTSATTANGSGVTPGNSTDPDLGDKGTGGAQGQRGKHGRLIFSGSAVVDTGTYNIDCGSYTGDVIVYQYDPADLTIRPQIHLSEPV